MAYTLRLRSGRGTFLAPILRFGSGQGTFLAYTLRFGSGQGTFLAYTLRLGSGQGTFLAYTLRIGSGRGTFLAYTLRIGPGRGTFLAYTLRSGQFEALFWPPFSGSGRVGLAQKNVSRFCGRRSSFDSSDLWNKLLNNLRDDAVFYRQMIRIISQVHFPVIRHQRDEFI